MADTEDNNTELPDPKRETTEIPVTIETVGLDEWPFVSSYYEIFPSDDGNATLGITLSFDAEKARQSEPDKKMATLDKFKQIVAPFSHEGIRIDTATTLGAVALKNGTAVKIVEDFAVAILSLLQSADNPEKVSNKFFIKATLEYIIDKDAIHLDEIFALEVEVGIVVKEAYVPKPEEEDNKDVTKPEGKAAEEKDKVVVKEEMKEDKPADEQDKEPDEKDKAKPDDEADNGEEEAIAAEEKLPHHYAVAVIKPRIYRNGTEEQNTLGDFAANLESALPFLKVATGSVQDKSGMPSIPGQTDNSKIWLLRLADKTSDKPLITFGAPAYFAMKPLSNRLASKSASIRFYVSGQSLEAQPARELWHEGIDLDGIARQFVLAVDDFISAHSGNESGMAVRQARQAIANAIAEKQLAHIVQGESQPVANQSKSGLSGELKDKLGNAYVIEAILQQEVTVNSGFSTGDFNAIGHYVTPGHNALPALIDRSVHKIRLSKPETEGQAQSIAAFFSSHYDYNPDSGKNEGIDHFPVGVDYMVTGIKYRLEANGPFSSLTLIRPILVTGKENKPAISTDILVPLRGYPQNPDFVSQAVAAVSGDAQDGNVKAIISNARQWTYVSNYHHSMAEQDALEIKFRYNGIGVPALKGQNDAVPELFDALVQFNAAYPLLHADLQKDQPSETALQSFAWIAAQAAAAWEKENSTPLAAAPIAEKESGYTLSERAGEEADLDGALLVTISSMPSNPAGSKFPFVTIEGFNTAVLKKAKQEKEGKEAKTEEAVTASPDSITYYFTEAGSGSPLLFADRLSHQYRQLAFALPDVFAAENAVLGMRALRNTTLNGKEVNPDFQYATAYRFADPVKPSLNSTTAIDLSGFIAENTGRQKLDAILWGFFEALFEGVGEKERMVEIECSYMYDLMEMPMGMSVTVPVVMVPPTSVSFDTEPDFLRHMASAVKGWYYGQGGSDTGYNPKFTFKLKIYAALQEDISDPVLSFEGLYVNLDSVDLS